ncbi:dihydrofolate reductase-like domain-containing protein [Roridomyces roridus]|uniref:2,5-diamino-6-ribosylamino-4(3H)-pyrimidinone 5'-phosphate reductase n=1 Tax=Roridomyces roridus TaxID=1738132 RepID=A0AAD7FLL9_9AGAR|nr:dihydrofolate reductase-like domain-containing protein [Roridomyces roridus]
MPAPDYLTLLFGRYRETPETRPFVTLDIGAKGGRPIALSGSESMRMTHWMRTMHDGILVGSGTAVGDDPQLNTRHIPAGEPHEAPTPIVLDSGLRMSVGCKLVRNYDMGRGVGKQPWVVGVLPSEEKGAWEDRRKALENVGVKVLVLDGVGLKEMLGVLRKAGIERLMVEGGARVIKSFLDASDVADTLLITTAPVLVGEDGVGWSASGSMKLEVVETRMEGRDNVVAFFARSSAV